MIITTNQQQKVDVDKSKQLEVERLERAAAQEQKQK